MQKILQVAWREFVSTAGTKAFIIGVLITPLMIGVMIKVIPLMEAAQKAPRVVGEVAIVDPTGLVAPHVGSYLEPGAFAERRAKKLSLDDEDIPEDLKPLIELGRNHPSAQMALERMLGEVPELSVRALPGAVDVEQEKTRLYDENAEGADKRLALAVIHGNAVERAEGDESFGGYDLFVRKKLDDRVEGEIRTALREGILEERLRIAGMDADEIGALTRVNRSSTRVVTAEGEKRSNEFLTFMLPAAFMALLLVSVLTGGQYLMTTTLEEKSSRVVEVLLSAVSPMQLMTGKVIGQLMVGVITLGLYAGMGLVALATFALLGFVDFSLIVYLVIFFVIAYFTIAALMAAIGAAVNDMREAQAMMMPIMLTMMIPWFIWFWIAREPNSLVAVILSLVPPVGPFVMMLRLGTATPPPFWQVALAIVLGIGGVIASMWFASKVFRVGLLMHGKPPNFKTLIKWVRMA